MAVVVAGVLEAVVVAAHTESWCAPCPYKKTEMLAEFETPNREELEKWLAAEKFHFDWLLRLEYETANGTLQAIS